MLRHCLASEREDGADLIAGNSREILQEIVDPIPTSKVVHERRDRNSGASEASGPGKDLRVARDGIL